MSIGPQRRPQDWQPPVIAVLQADGSGEVTADGATEAIRAGDVAQARDAVLATMRERARALGAPVAMRTIDPDGAWNLLVHPDGAVTEVPDQPDAAPTDRAHPAAPQPDPDGIPTPPSLPFAAASPAAERDAGPAVADEPVADEPAAQEPAAQEPAAQEPAAPPAAPAPPPAAAADPPPTTPAGPAFLPYPVEPARPRPTLQDLMDQRPSQRERPARLGWQGQVRRVSRGLVAPPPGAHERAQRDATARVQRSLNGPRTIVVVNPKGGAHKTTVTYLIAATLGRLRGGYVLAWDNNETRGTLGWRSRPAGHQHTAIDLLRDLDRFNDIRTLRVGDLDSYVRPQGSARFDVLTSDEDADSAASIDAEAFRRLHGTLARFYKILVVDTGNNKQASNWQAAVAAADQLVIVSTVREDTAQSAAWLIDALHLAGRAALVERAVTILSAPARTPDPALTQRLLAHFGQLTRTVLSVPHDPSLVSGGPIDYETLTAASRTAWLQVTAAVVDGL